MLGKWVRFDNKIPVDGIWWAQESPHSKDIGVQLNDIRSHPNPAGRNTAPSSHESKECALMTIP